MMGMQFFYMEHDFYAGQFTKTLFPLFNGFNADIALYFISILNLFKDRLKAELVRNFESFLLSQKIPLPVFHNEIDFDFMCRYIATLKAERVATLKAYLQAAGLSNTILSESELAALDALRQNRLKWREIPICGKNGAFNVVNTRSILKSQVVLDSGNIPYVGAGEMNNSVQSYISYDSNYIEKGNSIMIGGKTLVITYQEQDYVSNDSHNLALYYNDIENPNRDLQLFLASSLYRALKPKYHWGDSISKSKIKNDIIALPIKNDGSIDYDFIDNLISAQSKLCIHGILANKDFEISATEAVCAIQPYDIHNNSIIDKVTLSAEPFEIYKWSDVNQNKLNDLQQKETILIGCYRDNKHLEWILDNHIYNIRLGKHKGSAENDHKCFGNAKFLYLYDVHNLENVSIYRITGNREMTGSQLKDINYPRKPSGKKYMTFTIQEIEYNDTTGGISLNLQEVLGNLTDHDNGTPVFIEQSR